MSKFKERILFMALGGVLTLGILALVVWLKVRTPIQEAKTRAMLFQYSISSSNYFTMYGRWPQSIRDFVTNPSNVVFIAPAPPTHDAWSRPILYEPFDPARGYGRVVSFGRDGKPGGEGANADVEYRFGP